MLHNHIHPGPPDLERRVERAKTCQFAGQMHIITVIERSYGSAPYARPDVWIPTQMSAGFPLDASRSSRSFVSARVGGAGSW